MDRRIADRNILDVFCEEFCAIIDRYCKYIVVSGFVAIASGRTRGTEDIDIIIEKVDIGTFRDLFQELHKKGFECMQSDKAEEAYDYLKDNTSIRFTKPNQPLPEMEVKFAKDVLDQYQLEQRVKLEITGLKVWFSDINSNIAFKEELLKSPKDMEDAHHLRVVYQELIDEGKIKVIKDLIRRYRL